MNLLTQSSAKEREDMGLQRLVTVRRAGGEPDNCGADSNEYDVSGVNLQDPASDTLYSCNPARVVEDRAIGQAGRDAGNEDEDLGGVIETVGVKAKAREEIARQMIDIETDERQTASKVQSTVALW